MRVKDVCAAYLSYLERRAKAARYSLDGLENVRRDLGRFVEFVGNETDVADLRQHDLSRWIEANEQWKSICSQRNVVASVIGCFSWAEHEQLIDRCPYQRPMILKDAPDRVRRPALPSEYLQLRRHASRPLARALWFLWRTGARTCEMRKVLWAEVFLDDESPRIVLAKHKTARKTKKARIIALSPLVVRVLRMMKRRATTERVFVNSLGRPWDRRVFARNLRRLAVRLGMDKDGNLVSAYCLRHSYTCALMVAGFTSKQVADQLGHVDTKMVERVYGSHTREDLRYLSRMAKEADRKRA